ncbi:FXYD domain-containing ion transport regulator 7 isoform X2 [Tachyglossus aculeatus]|uniref:FXYD domain-containing ion transport regulator 7 isoform X2 n=1 Tax=Tachyglossus aculeatus TaxID=9261 RepID=UPI0018F318EC|nr:FXYD domain-containing ion transport regulator 7 isoform X2 [Tachyglossus aculeatus]
MEVTTKPPFKDRPDRFEYDYDTVRTVGLTLATIMFVVGIIIILTPSAPILDPCPAAFPPFSLTPTSPDPDQARR